MRKNCYPWTRENAKIKIFLPNNYKLAASECTRPNIEIFNSVSVTDKIYEVSKRGNKNNWYLVQDGHEIITFPPNIVQAYSSIRDFVSKATFGPNKFNAIRVSTLFMTNENGDSFTGMPFKAHSSGPWDKWTKNKANRVDFRPKVDTLQNTVRMWKHTDSFITISGRQTEDNFESSASISFAGRRVYPYTLVSMRYKPNSDMSYDSIGQINEKTQLMYGYYFFMGY